jgi:hypothetical protein
VSGLSARRVAEVGELGELRRGRPRVVLELGTRGA